MIDGLFERATHIPIWILSLGNAVVSIEKLEAKMTKHGRSVKSIALRYQHLPAVATEVKKATNQEFIVVGVDEDAPLLTPVGIVQPIREEFSPDVVQQHPNLGGSQITSTLALEEDLKYQVHDNVCAGESRGVVDSDAGRNDPHAFVFEGAADVDGEPRFSGHDSRGSLETEATVKGESR